MRVYVVLPAYYVLHAGLLLLFLCVFLDRGLNPRSNRRLFSAANVRRVLPLMMSAGLYDYSGQWAYEIGVPAKSGVGGCMFMVIPNVCGISIWSPRLDPVGNSVRAVQVGVVMFFF